jgi:glycosyltransferase involved in cell wall biosynthesis
MKILFVYNVDWFFKSHRNLLANELIKRKNELFLISNNDKLNAFDENDKIKFKKLRLSRGGIKLADLFTFFKLGFLIKRINPNIIEFATIKPIIIGGLISKIFYKKTKKIYWLTGLGHLFTGNFENKFSFKIIRLIYGYIFNDTNSKIIFENNEDRSLFIYLKITKPNQSYVIPGSFVDTSNFKFTIEPKEVSVSFIGRIQEDKGIKMYIDAIRILRRKGYENNFFAAGKLDDNPTAYTLNDIKKWEEENLIKYLGFKSEIKELFYNTNIICLPSKREGLPKVLVEAGASYRPSVVTNVPGCRNIIENGINGIVLKENNSAELANAIEYLIINKNKRIKLGNNAQKIVHEKFSSKVILKRLIKHFK